MVSVNRSKCFSPQMSCPVILRGGFHPVGQEVPLTRSCSLAPLMALVGFDADGVIPCSCKKPALTSVLQPGTNGRDENTPTCPGISACEQAKPMPAHTASAGKPGPTLATPLRLSALALPPPSVVTSPRGSSGDLPLLFLPVSSADAVCSGILLPWPVKPRSSAMILSR